VRAARGVARRFLGFHDWWGRARLWRRVGFI